MTNTQDEKSQQQCIKQGKVVEKKEHCSFCQLINNPWAKAIGTVVVAMLIPLATVFVNKYIEIGDNKEKIQELDEGRENDIEAIFYLLNFVKEINPIVLNVATKMEIEESEALGSKLENISEQAYRLQKEMIK